MRRFMTLARLVIELGGKVSFEWPKDSSGWHEKQTLRWMYEFGSQGLFFRDVSLN